MMITILILFTVIMLFMLYRNSWVSKVRINYIYTNMEHYQKLPSYDRMLFQVWKWNY